MDDKTERSQKWQEVCEENGWSYAIPEKTPEELQTYIQWQFWMAAGSFLVGIPMIIWFFRTKKTWVEADESSIQGSWGQEVQFKSIETLDKKKWKNKGIAKITYQQDGASKKFVLDDFKYQREPMGEIMKLIEASLNENQIVNGVTESPTKAGGESESGN